MGAISNKRGLIYYQLFDEHIDRYDFMSFIKKLLIRTGINVAIVMDNAGFHTASDCRDYYKKRKLDVIFIVPRVPMLIAIEFYFSLLKAQYRKEKFKIILAG